MKKQFLSILLSLCILLGLLPTAAFAATPIGTPLTQELLDTYLEPEDPYTPGNTNKQYKLPAGSYYLTENICLTYGVGDDARAWPLLISGAEVTLDLNGYVLDLRKTAISVAKGSKSSTSSLTLKDSDPGKSHKFRVEESGLWVWDETAGTETVTGGVITGDGYINTRNDGGGVCITAGCSFTMESGSIVGCAFEEGRACGGVYVDAGSFTMTGGSIVGCRADNGGVFVKHAGSFTMSGGNIKDCRAVSGGGVYITDGGSFIMNGGSIAGCTAVEAGGVYIAADCSFTMKGGSIEDCRADIGGGVFVVSDSFTMSGGSIKDCRADIGGGVFVNNAGSFTMNGGSISGCKAANGADNAVHADGTFTDNGTPKIDKSLLTGIKAGHTGTAEDPILIGSAAGLEDFRDRVNNDGETTLCAKLVCDVVLNNGTFYEDGRYTDANGGASTPMKWTPIGRFESISNKALYSGTFDGNKHTVKGLYVTGERAYAGLFGITEGATVKDLTVDGYVSASGSNDSWWPCTGGIVGGANNTYIENCTNLSTVESNFAIDGGNNTATVGGIAGNLQKGSLSNCRNGGKVILKMHDSDTLEVGGIVGSTNGQVSNCYNTGAVIVHSNNDAQVNNLSVGGVVGTNGSGSQFGSCYNTGAVTVTGDFTAGGTWVGVGGVVGVSNSPVSSSYNTGKVSCDNDNVNVGSVVGVNYDTTVTDCYFLKDTATGGVGSTVDLTGGTTGNTVAYTKAEFADGTVLNKLKKNDTTNAWGDNGYLAAAGMSLPLLFWQTGDAHTHEYDVRKYDSTHHWMECGCGLIKQDSKAEHSGTDDGNCTTAVVCKCGYEITAATSGHKWSNWVHNTTSHSHECLNPGCGIIQTENCSGGTATCTEQATCGACHEKYGETDPDNHTGTESWTATSTHHEKKWSCCGKATVDKELHEWKNGVCTKCSYPCTHSYRWKRENGKYWKECVYCNDKTKKTDIPEIVITGPDTVCRTQDFKFSFTLPDGAKDAEYTYEFMNSGEGDVKPTYENGIYSGTVAAADYPADQNGFELLVNAKTADGFTFYALKTIAIKNEHSGGTATCKDRAICEICGVSYGAVNPANHKALKHFAAVPSTAEKEGNIEYWYCEDCGKYFKDQAAENEITEADTVTAKKAPSIISGDKTEVTQGENKELVFKSNALFADFLRVELDGETLDEKNYEKKSGSTVITLKSGFVATLSAGEHTLSIVSQSGTATASFTVKAKTEDIKPTENTESAETTAKSPKTGDIGNPALLIALLFVSGGAVIGTAVGKKKKNNR